MSAKKASTIRIRQVRSGIGSPEKHKKILGSLGLGKLHRTVERPDTPSVRGMIAKIPHLVEIDQDAPSEK